MNLKHLAAAVLVAAALPAALAQDKPREEPFRAKGRPKNPVADKVAPIPAFPIPTPAATLPISKMKVPPGFKVEVYVAEIFDARSMRQGDKGTLFVSSLFGAGKLYAVIDKGGKREVKTLAEKLFLPSGIDFHKGACTSPRPRTSSATTTSRRTSTGCPRR